MGEIIKPGITLFLVTLIAAVLLGFVYSVTEKPIALQVEKVKTESMRELLPNADRFDEIEIDEHPVVAEAYEAISAETLLGYVVNLTTRGFGGDIKILVALNNDGTVSGVKILEHAETPGLGANATRTEFLEQYEKSQDAVDPSSIQAITSSTITTNAVTKGVNDALMFYNDYLRR